MEENRRRWRGGREVPVVTGDGVKWIEISVPPVDPNVIGDVVIHSPSEEDYSSTLSVEEPHPISFVFGWRINQTRILEVLQLSESSELRLRLDFGEAIHPFAFPFAVTARPGSTNGPIISYLYAVTASGFVYALDLSNTSTYESGSVYPRHHFNRRDVRPYLTEAQVTSVSASPGYIFFGRSDGCVSCVQPFLSPQDPDFYQELRDDPGFLHRWGLVRRETAAVRELAISKFNHRYLMNVLHTDGRFRVWDILCRYKLVCRSIATGDNLHISMRLWMGKADHHTLTLPFAVLFSNNNGGDYISLFWIDFTDCITRYLEFGVINIPLQGVLRDVGFTSDKIWILTADELTSQVLAPTSSFGQTQSYSLHEEHISQQLFLAPASSSHDLLLMTYSLFSSAKDRIMGFISSIFLGRLLRLGIFQDVALRLTLRDHSKHWSDSEFQSLSLDELRSEILLLIEQEVTGDTTISVFHWWENFCSRYFDHWCNNNEPRTLLVQSDVIGLVRNNSVSLFFRLENAEHSLGGPSSEHSNLTSLGSGMSHTEHEILLEMLNYTLKISKQLGTAPYAMYFESVTRKEVISSDEILSRLVNILESGYAMSTGQRTWSIEMFSALCQRAGSWEKVFTIMENYLQRLVPKKITRNNNGEALSDICSSILVQATSQFAKVMFDSAFDFFLLISYLLNISGQVNMSQEGISKLRLKLLPMIQDIVSVWLNILFFVTTPAESTSMNDCSFKLSSLQIDSSSIDNKRLWNKMLRKCGFSSAYILLFSDPSCIVDSLFNLRYLPDSQVITSLVQNFISLICYSKTGEDYKIAELNECY